MSVRFRIRTSKGQELSFASHQIFEEFVRSGDLAPDDLVYDGETSEWAPARTHPLVLEIEYEREDEEAVAAEARGASGDTTEAGSDDLGLSLAPPDAVVELEDEPESGDSEPGDAFGIELAPQEAKPTPQEESEAFLKKLESERELERDFGIGPAASGIRMEDPSVFADLARAEPEPEPDPIIEPAPRSDSPARRAASRRPPPKKKSAGKLVAAIVVLVAIGAGGYLGMGLIQATPTTAIDQTDPGDPDGTDGGTPADPVEDPEPPLPEPVIADTEAAVRERAQDLFLSSTQAVLADLRPIPPEWLSGEYLRLPSDHADAREIWQEYRATIRTLRGGDADRYRLAYERALDDAGVRDPARRSERLDAGTAAFADKLEAIDQHWARVDSLSVAAVQSHDALLGAEGLILHDPSGNTGRPSGIGRGTSGRDSDAQLLLDQVIELMGRTLTAGGAGPREGANVREWVWGGFLDVATR